MHKGQGEQINFGFLEKKKFLDNRVKKSSDLLKAVMAHQAWLEGVLSKHKDIPPSLYQHIIMVINNCKAIAQAEFAFSDTITNSIVSMTLAPQEQGEITNQDFHQDDGVLEPLGDVKNKK